MRVKNWLTVIASAAIISVGSLFSVQADEPAKGQIGNEPVFAVAIHQSGQLIVLYVVEADGSVRKFDSKSGIPAADALAYGNTAAIKEGFDTARACGVNGLQLKKI